jgi:hypothetical protein
VKVLTRERGENVEPVGAEHGHLGTVLYHMR